MILLPDRCSGRFQKWTRAASFALLVVSAMHAQAEVAQDRAALEERQWGEKPSQAEVERALTDLLLCEWMTDKGSSLGAERFFEVIYHLADNSPGGVNGDLVGEFHAFGEVFQRLLIATGLRKEDGGAVGWSGTSSADVIVRKLKQRGYVFEPISGTPGGFSGERSSRLVHYTVTVVDGGLPDGPGGGADGVMMMCEARATEEGKHQQALEDQKAKQIVDTVKSEERQPPEWADAILNEGSPRLIYILARYKWLNADQIERIVQSDDRKLRDVLLRNEDAPLSTAQLDRFLALGHEERVLRYRYDALTEAQVAGLQRTPENRSRVRLAAGGSAALEELEKILRTGGEDEIDLAFRRLRTITPEVIDLVLHSASRKVLVRFMQTQKPPYTPEQIERILATDDRDLHVWLVRNDKLSLTRAQYERGVMHPDDGISFWYRMRKDHTPSSRMIEEALTSPNPRTRELWLRHDRITLTPEQLERALTDPSDAARYAAFGRKDVTLTPAQLDACLREADFNVRNGCAERSELTLTQERFENIVGHPNPNVFRSFLRAKKGENINLAPYVRQAILTASDEILLRMLNRDQLPITADDVRTVRYTRSLHIQNAYCRRAPEVCRPQR